jgi:hypothetical protein
MVKKLIKWLGILLILSLSGFSYAQEKAKQDAQGKTTSSAAEDKGKQETAHEKASKKVKESDYIELDAMRIEGKIQKPDVQYIMTRGNLSYKWMSSTKSFKKDVINSVKQNPF